MKTLKQLLFAAAIVIGIAMTTSAQDKDQKNPPPKPSPPKIVVNPDKVKGEKPKEDKPKDERRKKPDSYMFRFRNE